MTEFHYVYKNQKYLVRVRPDIVCHGGSAGPGTMTSVWRVSNSLSENNENGVVPGVRGWQGKYTENELQKLLDRCDWTNR
jgi:hypothetical protein